MTKQSHWDENTKCHVSLQPAFVSTTRYCWERMRMCLSVEALKPSAQAGYIGKATYSGSAEAALSLATMAFCQHRNTQATEDVFGRKDKAYTGAALRLTGARVDRQMPIWQAF